MTTIRYKIGHLVLWAVRLRPIDWVVAEHPSRPSLISAAICHPRQTAYFTHGLYLEGERLLVMGGDASVERDAWPAGSPFRPWPKALLRSEL
jgi:hypothetical protein